MKMPIVLVPRSNLKDLSGYVESLQAIFTEFGLDVIVWADKRLFGGEYCHEFVASSEIGESRYFLEEGVITLLMKMLHLSGLRR